MNSNPEALEKSLNDSDELIKYSDYIPAIHEIELENIQNLEDGIKIIFRIEKLPDKKRFNYQFIRGGLGDGSIIHEFKSNDYIGDLKSLDDVKLKKTHLYNALYTNEIPLNLEEIINLTEIPGDYETFLKSCHSNPVLKEPLLNDTLKIEYGINKYYILGKENLAICDATYRSREDGETYLEEKPFIKAYPTEMKILQSPLLDRKIKYDIIWTSKTGHYSIKTEGNPKTIINQLDDSGLILDDYKANTKLAHILNWLAERKLLTCDYGIKEPGFHWLEDKIITVDYDCQELPSPEDLKKSLNILEDFGSYFKTSDYDIRDKVATIFKLTLLNPFDYVKKQLGYDREIPFLYGAPGTAKTSLLQLVMFVYEIPKDYFMESGGSANTPAQLSGLMKEKTFPIMVDEAENIFKKPELVSLNKQAMNGLYSRKIRDTNQNEIPQPSYATLLYNSNEIPFKLSKDGSVRRYNIIHFDETQRPSEDDKEDFKDKWKASDKGHYQADTPLKHLKYIGQFVAYDILNNPGLLKEDNQTLTDKLVNRMYLYAELSGGVPGWLKDWCNLEDEKSFRASENEKILYFMRKAIEKAHKLRVQEVTEDFRPENTFEDDIYHKPGFYHKRIFEVANNPALPWLSIQKIKSEPYYLISSGILEELSEEIGLNITLSELEARFKPFENKPIRRKSRVIRMVKVPKKDFEELLYPEFIKDD